MMAPEAATPAESRGTATQPAVLDTNVVLDLYLFQDPATLALQTALTLGRFDWIATLPMRTEFERVLDYPWLKARMQARDQTAQALLERFDRDVRRVEPAPRAAVVCKDPDDQKFIDLAIAHRAVLLSKDRAVQATRKRLLRHGVVMAPTLDLLDRALAAQAESAR